MRHILLAAFLVTGCERTSALYCHNNPDKCISTGTDAPIGGQCTNESCAAANPQLPFCIDTTVCAGCRDDADCAEPLGVCDLTTHACRGCAANGECPSQVCIDANSTCAPQADVGYVGGTGPSTTCTLDAPCASINLALALMPRPHFIRMVDDVTELDTVIFDGAAPVMLLGNNHTIHTSIGGNGLQVRDQIALSIANVDITPSAIDTMLSHDCIFLEGTPTLRLVSVNIHGCGGDPVNASAGTTTIESSNLHNSNGYGIEITNGATAALHHTTIHHNALTGVSVGSPGVSSTIDACVIAFNGGNTGFSYPGLETGSDVVVTNTIITRNGSNAAFYGGVRITGGNSTFEFDTISDNISNNAPAKGISCTGMATFRNCIITGNEPSGALSCPTTYSFLDTGGSTNLGGNPMFVPNIILPTDPLFYHLQSTSPAIGKAQPDPNVPKDIDGDSRDSSHPDMGADEHH